MSCQDDLTAVDLHSGVAVEVLERVSAGEGRDENLYAFINHNNVTGLNIEDPEAAKKIIKTWDERHDMEIFCESGVDDQMIIHIPFIHSLRLRSLLLLPPPPDSHTRPTRIRLYTNLPHAPSFSDIEAMEPVQEIGIAQSPAGWQAGVDEEGRGAGGRREVEEWPLKVQKMASVWSVTLMIGESRAPKRSETEGGTVPAANAADAPVPKIAEKQGASHSVVR
ncbi:hypothetical protein QFC20_001172 [Naganishia adeliensis]|uniref:Uncharacterized protein n=1 Tax=Naganishia adeliensis TaxID=92952 RepID=A0ACC2WVX4_9TREE|nr:hypothetical protein QFC20_001172 [Naganishia adeliensis]